MAQSIQRDWIAPSARDHVYDELFWRLTPAGWRASCECAHQHTAARTRSEGVRANREGGHASVHRLQTVTDSSTAVPTGSDAYRWWPPRE
jgi:hypothetical protein